MLVSLQAASSMDFCQLNCCETNISAPKASSRGRYQVYSCARRRKQPMPHPCTPGSLRSPKAANARNAVDATQKAKNMNNQGWPNERCEACGLRAKLNMGAGANAPLY